MGCGFSKSEGKAKCQLRVLVLGIQSSGKSTFAKQMKILHCNGFRDDEKNNYRDILTQNLLLGMKELLGSAEDLKPSNKKVCPCKCLWSIIDLLFLGSEVFFECESLCHRFK